VAEITPEQVAEIRARYTEEPVPPCRICGDRLSIQATGAGRTTWACSTTDDDHNVKPGRERWETGPDSHYSRSYFYQYRRGDEDVLALCTSWHQQGTDLAAAKAAIGRMDIHATEQERLHASHVDEMTRQLADANRRAEEAGRGLANYKCECQRLADHLDIQDQMTQTVATERDTARAEAKALRGLCALLVRAWGSGDRFTFTDEELQAAPELVMGRLPNGLRAVEAVNAAELRAAESAEGEETVRE
jgi:hypothetical protein